MSRNTRHIDVSRTDRRINRILADAALPPAGENETSVCFYNQNEDQFILLPEPIDIPSVPVHQGMDDATPPEGYVDGIMRLASDLVRLNPRLIAGTSWYFDPVDIHTPTFYRIVTIGETAYLYLLLVDLTCRPLECEILERGTNERTSAYRTSRLYFECDWFPLESTGPGALTIDQSIPFTWKGEAGQGYMIHGIWMDTDINKFFTKLILPRGKRNYPYYPITCKQHCVSMNAFGQSGPELLDGIRKILEPTLADILEDLHSTPFSEQMTLFSRMKQSIPPELGTRWDNLSVSVTLNEREQKEYTVEF